MLGSQILDVAIGLVFVYLLVSLIVSVVNEWIARLFALRASTLEDGLRNLLQDPTISAGDVRSLLDDLYNHPLIQGASPLRTRAKSFLNVRAVPIGTQTHGLSQSQRVVSVPPSGGGRIPAPGIAIASGMEPEPAAADAQPPQAAQGQAATAADAPRPSMLGGPVTRTGRPSYIAARNFSLALLDLVAPVGLHSRSVEDLKREFGLIENTRLRRTLLVLVNSGERDLESVRASIETWFNDGMERVSGWYKRKIQVIGLVVGLVLAIVINADTFAVVRTLWTQPTVRDALARSAEQYVQKNGADPNSTLDGQRATIERSLGELSPTNLPIGWDLQPSPPPETAQTGQAPRPTQADPRRLMDVLSTPSSLLSKLLGLLLTGAAVSLGAHFWFDTLSRLTSFRSTGDPPSTETQK